MRELMKDGKIVKIFEARELLVLAPCQQEFFIRQEDPNYKKMIIDLRLKDVLTKRTRIIQKIRDFFVDRDFVDTETPELVRLPGMEPYLDIFKTQFYPQDFSGKVRKTKTEEMYLITSPEYALKKLLVAGFEKIFQVCKAFRNKETASELHNPEFTLLEFYRAYASYEEIMQDTEELVLFLTEYVTGGKKLKYKELEIDVSLPWRRLKVKDAFQEYAGVNVKDFEDVERLRNIAKDKGYQVNDKTSYDDLFFLIFMNEIEPKLGLNKPVFLCEYPASMAALSKKCEYDARYAERVEAYIGGVELANGFTELNDPKEQIRRLEAERKERQKLQKDDYPVDQSFIGALECGMPPSGGIAIGVDRLIMLLTNTPDIRSVLFFPHRDL